MGFMGFGGKTDSILDVNPKEVSRDIARLEVQDQRLSIDLDKTNNQIELKMEQGSDPSLKAHEREKFALQITSLQNDKSRFESQLAEARKRLRSDQVLNDVLQRFNQYESDIQKKIRDTDPEELRAILENMAVAKKGDGQKYDDIIKTGQILVQGNVFELDTDTASVLKELERRAGEGP